VIIPAGSIKVDINEPMSRDLEEAMRDYEKTVKTAPRRTCHLFQRIKKLVKILKIRHRDEIDGQNEMKIGGSSASNHQSHEMKMLSPKKEDESVIKLIEMRNKLIEMKVNDLCDHVDKVKSKEIVDKVLYWLVVTVLVHLKFDQNALALVGKACQKTKLHGDRVRAFFHVLNVFIPKFRKLAESQCPSDDLYENVFKPTVSSFNEIAWDGAFVEARHKFLFICKILNEEFFRFDIQSDERKISEINISENKQVDSSEEDFKEPVKLKIKITARLLQKYAAHVVDLPPPNLMEILKPPEDANNHDCCIVQTTNQRIYEMLLEKEIVDIRGRFREDLHKDSKKAAQRIAKIAKKAIKECSKGDSKIDLIEKCTGKSIYNKIMKWRHVRKNLDGLTNEEALYFTSRCLDFKHEHGMEDENRRKAVQRDVNLCRYLDHCLNLAFREDGHEGVEKVVGKLARKIVSLMCDKKRSLLIPTGSPIRHNQETSSHTFYACLKVDDGNVQIALINGGAGCENHQQVETDVKNDWSRHYCVVTRPVQIAKHLKALRKYVEVLLATPYKKAKKKGKKSYKSLLDNLYIPSGGFLYKRGKVKNFERRDSKSKSFPEQWNGNCTVMNLMYAVRILHGKDRDEGMNELEYGSFQDQLLLGLDNYITECRPRHSVNCLPNNEQINEFKA